MAPTDNSGVMGGGQAIRFLIPVTKGLDYVFLCDATQGRLREHPCASRPVGIAD
jgi:hypothetical protein